MSSELSYLPYTVAADGWDPDELGNHRAVVRVDRRADVVRVSIPWRRRDRNPEAKGVIVHDAVGGKISHYLPVNVSNTFGEFLFEPSEGPGRYYFYFMAYTGTVKKPYPQIDYLPAGLENNAWQQDLSGRLALVFDLAEVVALESVDEFNMFTEMELIADDTELSAFVASQSERPFLAVAESRVHPIRMTDRIPYRWTQRESADRLTEDVRRGEYFAFQIGVFAPDHDLGRVSVIFEDIVSTASEYVIPKNALTCFNTHGVGWDGALFEKSVSVSKGHVQPLWCGIDLPSDIPLGELRTTVVIDGGEHAGSVDLILRVVEGAIPHHGDDDPWRLSKLRWLDSTDGTEDTVFPPYVPVVVEGSTISVLGRDLVLGENGLPAQVYSRFSDDLSASDSVRNPLLTAPSRFRFVSSDGTEIQLSADSLMMTDYGDSFARWSSVSSGAGLKVTVSGKIEFDGNIEYAVEVLAEKDLDLADIALEMVLSQHTARYMTGLGRKGGRAPDDFSWKWDVKHNQDAVWIGNVNGGMQITLKDENYSRPLNTNFYHLKPLVMPNSWSNGGNGGIALKRSDDVYNVKCFSGPRTIAQHQKLHFNLRLLLTPFKPLNTKAHFGSRYCHAFVPVADAAEMGANTINIHHATAINPYINYPFLRPDELRSYVEGAHAQDSKVKLYYTVREITTRMPELFALHSLDGEIVVDGAGGGHAWIQEHLGGNYIAAWYALAARDTSVINGVLSRWHNFYVKGLDWLAENMLIDGVYIDDLGFGREIMQRVRRVLHRHREQPVIDLHSANQYNEKDGFASSTNLYLEHFPYLDRLWFGEYFDYNENPDYWLVEVSGIPFGLLGEMLQDGGNPWRGMIFGMTARMPRVTVNSALWQMWDTYQLPDARMTGFWSDSCPVVSNDERIPATVYAGKRYTVVALASWAEAKSSVTMSVDWQKLGYEQEETKVYVPYIRDFQELEERIDRLEVSVSPGKGKLVVFETLK
jgi:hypothetical protein